VLPTADFGYSPCSAISSTPSTASRPVPSVNASSIEGLTRKRCDAASDRQLRFASLAAASDELARLAEAKELVSSAAWGWGQTLDHCAQSIEFRCVPMERLGLELAGERFDGVWSNFGAINCVPKLDAVVADLAALLEPGAPLAWVVLGKDVPWEWAWFLSRGNARKAFRRRQRGGAVWRGMRIVYPTPAELTRTLAPYFAPTSCRSLGFVLPPSYASGWLERRPRLLAALTHVERAAQQCQPLAALSDHYVFEARRADD